MKAKRKFSANRLAVMAIAASAAAMSPQLATAAAYYYAFHEITEVGIRGEYLASDGTRILARPGSLGDGSDSTGLPPDASLNATTNATFTGVASGGGGTIGDVPISTGNVH